MPEAAMTAERPDDFPYEISSTASNQEVRAGYWSVASGLQAVDKLAPSAYMQALAQDYIEGKRSVASFSRILIRTSTIPLLPRRPRARQLSQR